MRREKGEKTDGLMKRWGWQQLMLSSQTLYTLYPVRTDSFIISAFIRFLYAAGSWEFLYRPLFPSQQDIKLQESGQASISPASLVSLFLKKV